MAPNFNGKTAQEIVDYLGLRKPADFEQTKEAIETLDPALCKEVINIIEKDLVSGLFQNVLVCH
ncbi:MAG: hypothetical protein KGL10_02295 [Alphaproteobacteria bacterium]|nr:hypothetical protein [Alphaproteobacteria bacterium]